ncbi:MAG TPA: serine/threonine-protein kinase [Blastocatellia bacterium]|nr:serine/threonine-protein kinase [Blastocatellia bacterium]
MNDLGEKWLRAGQYASIEGMKLRPKESQRLVGSPIVISRGQADAYFLTDNKNQQWILKKFLPGRNPDAGYIKALQALIPQAPGFESGYKRRVLHRGSLSNSDYYSSEFLDWIEHTVLMPKIPGWDWAYLADQIRDGVVDLTREQRLLICKNLSEKVALLESNKIAHRDLSASNVFIETKTWEVHLIDWDSIYHPHLSMPPNTTYGTNGYIAPFVRLNQVEDPKATWRPLSDRFSLAVMNAEFLLIDKDSPLTGDGGMFDQQELYESDGPGIRSLLRKAREEFPDAARMLERALRARSCEECAGPSEWRVWNDISTGNRVPSLSEIYDPKEDFEEFLQKIRKPRPPAPQPPRLSELESVSLKSLPISTGTKPAHRAPRLSEVEDPTESLTRGAGQSPAKAPK